MANITPQQILVLARCGIPMQWQTLPQRPSSTSTSSHLTQICLCMGESELHSCVDSWYMRKGRGHPSAVAGCLLDVNDGIFKTVLSLEGLQISSTILLHCHLLASESRGFML